MCVGATTVVSAGGVATTRNPPLWLVSHIRQPSDQRFSGNQRDLVYEAKSNYVTRGCNEIANVTAVYARTCPSERQGFPMFSGNDVYFLDILMCTRSCANLVDFAKGNVVVKQFLHVFCTCHFLKIKKITLLSSRIT